MSIKDRIKSIEQRVANAPIISWRVRWFAYEYDEWRVYGEPNGEPMPLIEDLPDTEQEYHDNWKKALLKAYGEA